ncbi:MAG: hypothetical protein ABR975_14980 [Vulcanimicrobiaceae bacterium]|jgi:hypothetical protein
MMLALPTALALAGTAVAAFAILAPRKLPAVPLPAAGFAAPASIAGDSWSPMVDVVAMEPMVSAPLAEPVAAWPLLVDPAAAGADAVVRGALVDALGTVDAPWARALLERAREDEPDPAVRAAIRLRLGG